MRFELGVVSFAAICAVAFVLPVWSHHSHGNYVDTFTDLEGVVKEVHLVVPHSWVYLEVKDAKGEPETWALETKDGTVKDWDGNNAPAPSDF